MSKLKSAILSVIGPKVFSEAKVVSNEKVADSFRLIELESISLRNSVWRPGGKVQINTGNWVVRTYTPLAIDAESARMKILAYLPGYGPGSAWSASVKRGDTTNLKGPERSINFSEVEQPILLFGDETSIALAAGVNEKYRGKQPLHFIFEASSKSETEKALEQLGITDANIVSKEEGIAVHENVLKDISGTGVKLADCHMILSGRAQSIQALRSQFKIGKISFSKLTNKPYWSKGKAGLE